MSLATNISDLATRVATEAKALRTLINGNAADLSSLTTTAKTNLVAAINELDAAIDAIGGSPAFDDLSDVAITTPANGHIVRFNNATGLWENVLGTTYFDAAGDAAAAQAASQPLDSDLTAIAALATTSYGRALLTLADAAAFTATNNAATETAAGIVELATTTEATTGTDTSRAVTPAGVAAAIAALVASAPGTLDTLNELAAALGDDPNFATTMTTALAGKQPLDTDLTAIAALVSAADKLPYATGAGTWALTTLSSFARTFLDDADAATVRTTIGAQQSDAELSAIAGLTSAANKLPYFTGSGTAALADLSAFGRTLIDDADAATALTTLGAQAADADLAAIAALTSAADKLPYATGAGTWAMATFTAAGRALVDDADAAAQRTTLSVYSQTEIGDPTTDFVAVFNAGLA